MKNKRDKTSNATSCIVASGIAKSSTPLTTQRIRNLQTSPVLLKAVSEQSIEDILFHAKINQRSNNIDPILTEKVISFYNNDKIYWVVPNKNATVLDKNSDGTKECVCLRILEKRTEATILSVMKIQNVQLNWENLENFCPWNVRLRKMAQRAACCCTWMLITFKRLVKDIAKSLDRTQQLYHAMKSFVIIFSVKNETSNATTKNALAAKQSPWHGLRIWNAVVNAMWKMLIVMRWKMLSILSNLNELSIFILVNQRRSQAWTTNV